MSHVWTVAALDYTVSSGGKTNVVGTVHWRATKTQGDDVAEVYGSVGLAAPGDTFIEWANISEANAIAWAKAALGSDEVARLEASLDAQLTEKVTPTTGSGQPWAA